MSAAPSPSRILIVLAAGIGDFVMATPALRALRRGFPVARISLLTIPQATKLASACPFQDEILDFDLRTYRPAGRGTGIRGHRRFRDLTRALRARRFDLAVNLYRVATLGGTIRMLVFLVGIRARQTAGRWCAGRGFFFGIRAPDRLHELEAMLSVARVLGCPTEDALPELFIPEPCRHAITARLKEAGLGDAEPFAVLNIGSNRSMARLPAHLAVELGREISGRGRAPVLVTGDMGDLPFAATIASQIGPRASCFAGRTDLLELAALLERASVVISTDSGPMHMAAALGTPLVALFGPADPAHTAPRGLPDRILILQGSAHPRDPLFWHADLSIAQAVETALRFLDLPRPNRLQNA